jgi:chromosome segregation ATPase
MKRMEQSVNQLDNQIKDLENKIAAENERMAAHTQARHDEMQRRLAAAREALETAEANSQQLRVAADDKAKESEAIKAQGVGLAEKIKELQGSIKNCEGMIDRARQAQNNSLVPYGKNIREVLQQIGQTRWQGDKPLGPLGMFVKAKDPKTWGHLLRSQLAGFLTAFAVTNDADRNTLRQLLAKHGKQVSYPHFSP